MGCQSSRRIDYLEEIESTGREENPERKTQAMIARIWQGQTLEKHKEEYLGYLQRTGLRGYQATKGNLGALVLHRDEDGKTHFLTLSFWDSVDSIKLFAGDEYEKARYYPEDEKYLLTFEPTVTHFEVLGSLASNRINATEKPMKES
jgi:heme-degrading monooxygenase HmoA